MAELFIDVEIDVNGGFCALTCPFNDNDSYCRLFSKELVCDDHPIRTEECILAERR